MAKHLFYTDVHMKRENLAWCRVVFQAIEAAAEEHGVISSGGYVVNNGDLFNERGVIPTSVFDELAATRRRWAEKRIQHIDNVGNHDQEDRDGKMHPLRVFDTFPGSRVISEPTFVEGVRWWFFPYSHGLRAQLQEHANFNPRPHQVAFIHAGIKSAYRNDKSQDLDGLDVADLRDFKRVFSGHYHYRHTLKNVTYLGSVMQHSLSEAGQAKGFHIYDDSRDELTFHEIAGTPRYFDMELQWTDKGWDGTLDPKLGKPTAIDTIMFRVNGPAEAVRALTREALAKLTPATNIKVDRNITDETVSRMALDEKDHGDLRSLMEKYVGHVDPGLDRARLLKVGQELAGL